MAIRRNAPIEVIRCLVDANPSATTTRDRGDGLPLRRAIESQASLEVLQCLCTSKLIVLDVDRHVQNTALHGSLECGTARASTVQLLTRVAPEVALIQNRYGETPLSLACQRYMKIRGHGRDSTSVDQLWNIVVLLLRAAYYDFPTATCDGYHDPHESLVLHAALCMGMPHEIILKAIQSFPEQAAMPGKDGLYPLLIVIKSMKINNQREILLRILDLYPDAALAPDQNGRTALSLLAEADTFDVDVFRRLWKANPDAGKQIDPVHGIFPFQVAALPKTMDDSKTKEKAAERNQLSAIFELLSTEPSILWRSEGLLPQQEIEQTHVTKSDSSKVAFTP